jgi:hypothetical protein
MGTAVRGYGTAHMMYGSEHSSSQWRTKYKLEGHYSHKRVSCATWDPATYFFKLLNLNVLIHVHPIKQRPIGFVGFEFLQNLGLLERA